MPNEKFWDTVSAVLGGLPPAVAGFVLLVLAAAVLVYSWRRATDEAKKERGKAESTVAAMSDQKLDAILTVVNATAERVADMQTDLAVLRDRGKR